MELLINVVKEWDYVRLFPRGDEDIAETFGCDYKSFDSSIMLRVFKIEEEKIGLARAEFFVWGSENLDGGCFGRRLCEVHWNIMKVLSSERYLVAEKLPEEVDGASIKGIKELYVLAGNGSDEFPYEVWL